MFGRETERMSIESFIVSKSGNASSNLLPFQLVLSNSLALAVISYVSSFLFCAATFFTVEVTFEITLPI